MAQQPHNKSIVVYIHPGRFCIHCTHKFGEFDKSDVQQLADRLMHQMVETNKIDGYSIETILTEVRNPSFDSESIQKAAQQAFENMYGPANGEEYMMEDIEKQQHIPDETEERQRKEDSKLTPVPLCKLTLDDNQ